MLHKIQTFIGLEHTNNLGQVIHFICHNNKNFHFTDIILIILNLKEIMNYDMVQF